MLTGLLIETTASAACPLFTIEAEDPLALMLPMEGTDRTLPRDSLIIDTGSFCHQGHQVQVVALPWQTQALGALPSIGDQLCIPPARLRPTDVLLKSTDVHNETRSPSAGSVVGPLNAVGDGCALWTDGTRHYTLADLQGLQPVSTTQLDALELVKQTYHSLFDGSPWDNIGVTPWGYVMLPMAHSRSQVEIAEAWKHEQLNTPLQREKALTELGPTANGHPIYAHFTGSDRRFTDTWGNPQFISQLLRLIAGWYDHCTNQKIPDASPKNCTVQVGDIAWFGPQRPDPLGHRDHYLGRCADIRLFRSDGSRYEAWWNRPDDRPGFDNRYSRPLTQAFAAWAITHGATTLLFSDPVVVEAVAGVEDSPHHDDHLHLCIEPTPPGQSPAG